MIGDIKETVARAVPGLTQDRVSVMLESFIEKIIPPQTKKTPWYESNIAFVCFGVLGALLLSAASLFILFKKKFLKFERNTADQS